MVINVAKTADWAQSYGAKPPEAISSGSAPLVDTVSDTVSVDDKDPTTTKTTLFNIMKENIKNLG